MVAGKDINNSNLSNIVEIKKCFRKDSEFRSKIKNAAAHLIILKRLFKIAAISPFDYRYFIYDSLI